MKLYVVWLRGYYEDSDSIDSYWLDKDAMIEYIQKCQEKWSIIYGLDEWGDKKYFIMEEEIRG